MKKILFALALSLAAAGCAEGLGPEDLAPRLTFTAAAQQGQAPAQPQITVAAIPGGFQVDGVLATPDVCRVLAGEFMRYAPADAPILMLTVRVAPTSTGCTTAVGRFAYSARVERVPPGRYPVEVYHEFQATGNPNPFVVFSGEIQIP